MSPPRERRTRRSALDRFFRAQLLQIDSASRRALMWNKDEVRGKTDQVKGKIKKSIGNATDDEQLRDEGVADEAAGNVEEAFGKGRRKVGEALNDLGDKVGR